MVSDKLKQIIFKRLYKELGNAEIIPYKDSIWFIDREEKYWYFDFENSGALYWRYGFFPNFFEMFSLEREDFEPILASWVEEVLNSKVSITCAFRHTTSSKLGDVLNSKVLRTGGTELPVFEGVDDVLNHKVSTTDSIRNDIASGVEEVLNHRVSSTVFFTPEPDMPVEEVLNHKVFTTNQWPNVVRWEVGEVLNHKAFTKIGGVWRGDELVEEILDSK